MKKQGPCRHCGAESTPLWRNGPPDKPVLCNACGSRWRLGKPLENYTPKMVQVPRGKKGRVLPTQKNSVHLRKPKLEEDFSNNSIAYCSTHSEGPINYSVSSGEITKGDGSSSSTFWDHQIPSRKRSEVLIGFSPQIEKLHRDLYNLVKYEDHDQDEDLLIDNKKKLQFSPKEIGLGCILLKPPKDSSKSKY